MPRSPRTRLQSRQQRRALAAGRLSLQAGQAGREHDDRQEGRDLHQLDDGRDVAGFVRHAVARPHHLRHVVNRCAKEDTRLLRIEPESPGETG